MEDHESGEGHKQFGDRQEAGGGVWKIEDGGEKGEMENRARGLPIPGGQRGRGGGRMGGRGIRGGAKQERWAGAKVGILVKSEPDDEKYKQGIPTHKSTHSLSKVKLEKKECGRVNKSPAEGLFCTECHQKLKPGHVAHRRRGKQEIYCSSSCLASHIASSKLPANQLPSPLSPQHPVVPPSSASHLHNPHQSTVEEAASTSIPCSVCGKNTPARHEVTYQNETFQLCSDKCLTRFGSQHQTPVTENQRENKATRSVCHYCMGSASPQYFLNMSNGTRYAVCSTDCLSAFQLLLSQGVLPVPLPPLSEISPPAPPSAPVVLKCIQCRESFSHIPDLLEWKGTVLQFCGRACVRIWARNVTAVCDQCRRSKPVACRAHFPGLSCTFCSDTCRWLHQAAFSRKLGKGAGTCTHCLQLCSRSSAQSSSVSRLCFCSNICQKSYTLCYIKAYPCDRCQVTCAPEAFLPWGGAVRRFCNHACLMLYCFDQAGGGLLGNIVTSSSGEEKPTDILDKLDAGTSLGSSNSTISSEEHSTSHGFTKSNHNASVFAVGEVQVGDHSKNQTLGTSQAKQRASRREQVAWSVGEGDISRAAGRTDVEVALRAWLRGSLGRKHRIDASQLLSKAQRLSFEIAAAFTPTHPWLRGFVAREGISLGDTERDLEDTLGVDGDGENNANVNSHPSPDDAKISRIPFPVPVPIYVPVPMHMYCQPTPSPVALPIPIPVPLLIPSSKVSEQRKAHSEAEQAQEKGEEERFNLGQGGLLALPAKKENSKSKRKSEIIAASVVASPASLESRSRLSHSVASPSSSVCPNTYLDPEVEILNSIGSESKAKLSLGHKAWKLWADGSLRPKKGQPSVFLSLSQSERASALYAFASEAQRPNGQDYRPDCLYYLCLGLQRYLSEAGIEDDIFSDSIYGDFFGALSSKLAAWQVPESQRSCLSSQLLWLSGRLGARSPSSLQAALSYFLFWGFGIRNVDAHARLTFSRLAAGPRKARRAGRMERRERRGGCKPLCLGLYPAVSPTCEQGNSGRKRRREDEPEKEIPEDAENPLHCPVRLFEFYISKCPAEVRARDGPLYLEPLVPCDPDSNLWFSDTALSPRSLLSLLAPLPHLQDLSLKK